MAIIGPLRSSLIPEFAGELCATVLLAGMPRWDQRRKAALYLSCLLATEGRKTVRNIASRTGDPAAHQRLHHFIAKSRWEDRPVRRALACQVDLVLRPEAWIVAPMAILKKGMHSVGVDCSYVPELGRVANSQQAMGLWLAGEGVSIPVNWRLMLPASWLGDRQRRLRAEIPDSAVEMSVAQYAIDTVVEALEDWRLTPRPVLMDGREQSLATRMSREFVARGIPALLRIDPATPLAVADPALPGYGAGPMPAGRLVDAVRGLRVPLPGDGFGSMGARRPLAVAVRVGLPGSPEHSVVRRAETTFLLGEWEHADRKAARVWIATAAEARPIALTRLMRLAPQAERHFADIGARAGLCDFEGRTYRGWNHHATLSSLAHAVLMLRSATPK